MVALLLAAALLQAPSPPLGLDCQATERRAGAGAVPVIMLLDVQDGRIATVLMDGSPFFSSYRQVAGPRRELPRNAQWRGSFQGRAIRLRRRGTDMVLEPAADAPGVYAGFWTFVEMVEHRRVERNGLIRCLAMTPTSTESARR